MWSDGMRQYIAIDLKSFYASVECVERGLNPLTTNLVVADESRTEKTICFAIPEILWHIGAGALVRSCAAGKRDQPSAAGICTGAGI